MAAIPASVELAIRALSEDVRPASHWLARSCQARGVPDDQILRLDLCLNEALANVISHGGAQALAAPVRLRVHVSGDAAMHQASVTVYDSGPAFDATSVQPGELAATLDEAEPGGLGLRMIRNLSDSLSYWHDQGHNELTFGVCWSDA